MRAIAKGVEPPSLATHRAVAGSNYGTYMDRGVLRGALVAEQRGLCCYCMMRITNDPLTTKIEHWLSQQLHPEVDLDYRNLLGACRGGEGQPSHKQHCDTRKANRELKWNPAEPLHQIEARVFYATDGAICSTDEEFNVQLNDVLNLNLDRLKNNRRAVLDAVIQWWKAEKARLGGPLPRERFVRRRNAILAGHADLNPYCQIAIWWFDLRLTRMAA